MRQIIYKLIYNSFINRFLRNLNKLLYCFLPTSTQIPPSGTIKIKLDTDNYFYLKTNQTSYLTKILFWQGANHFEYTTIFRQLIKKIDVFYDIGANIGYYSIIASVENPRVQVTSFEPALGPLFYIKENIKLNNCKNISIEDFAISNDNGYSEFYEITNPKYSNLKYNLSGEHHLGSKLKEKLSYKINNVKTITLDHYVEFHNIKKIDLIKIDTEGTEHLILENAHFILKEMKPIIICEILFNKIEAKLEKIMNAYNYHFYHHTINGLEKVDSLIRKQDDGVRNCFFVHPEKQHLIEEFIAD